MAAANDEIREFRGAVMDAQPGDHVDVAHSAYDYTNPLTVEDATEPVLWRVPEGHDWLTRAIDLEGNNGGAYTAVYNSATGDFELQDGDGKRIADVTQFEIVDDAGDDGAEWTAGVAGDDESWDVGFDVPDHVTPGELQDAVDASATLYNVLVELDWPTDGESAENARSRVRALVFTAGLYDDLSEPEAWPTEKADKRGWQ